MTLLLFLLLLLLLLRQQQAVCAGRTGTSVPAGMELIFVEDDARVYLSFSASATQGNAISLAPLFAPKENIYGCKLYHGKPQPAGSVFLAKRGGGCTFTQKLKNAQRARAAALIVVNTLESLYNSSTGNILDPCALDCDASVASAGQCKNALLPCAPKHNLYESQTSCCCVDDALIDMYIEENVDIPAYFAGMADANVLFTRAALRRSRISIQAREFSEYDFSLVFIYTFACSVLISCSYLAATSSDSRPSTAALRSGNEEQEQDGVSLTPHSSLLFLVTSTCALLLLFALVQWFPVGTVIVIQLLFALAAASSLSQIIIRFLLPPSTGRRDDAIFFACCLLALAAFLTRHYSFAWMSNNLLGACVVLTFFLHVRVPDLRTATLLLGVFFLYDIFMVFFTPLLFAGKSVMVEVATAGRGAQEVNALGECVRRAEERLPMLFSCPRTDFWGGSALLGLGDVVLPGLVVVLALRLDLSHAPHQRRARLFYWPWLCFAYCLGLALALLANIKHWTINGVAGQPALMYLVPTTLLCFHLLAWYKEEWDLVWKT